MRNVGTETLIAMRAGLAAMLGLFVFACGPETPTSQPLGVEALVEPGSEHATAHPQSGSDAPGSSEPVREPKVLVVGDSNWDQLVHCRQVYGSLGTSFDAYFSALVTQPEWITSDPVFLSVTAASRGAMIALDSNGKQERGDEAWEQAIGPSMDQLKFIFSDVKARTAACDAKFGLSVASALPPMRPATQRPKAKLLQTSPELADCTEFAGLRNAFLAEVDWVRSEQARLGDIGFQSSRLASYEAASIYSRLASRIKSGACSGVPSMPAILVGFDAIFGD